MSRGGRGRGGGAGRGRGRKIGGPETTWDVEPTESSTKPEPLFPVRPMCGLVARLLTNHRECHNLFLKPFLDQSLTE